MNTKIRYVGVLLSAAAALFALPETASAYGGPGSVVSGVGAFLAALAALVAAVFGFVWFPLKRLIQKLRGGGEDDDPAGAGAREDLAGR